MTIDVIVQEKEIARVDFNFEELKKELAEQLEKYQDLVVVEDQIPEYKKDRAHLNKLRTALKKVLVDIKNKYMIPVTEAALLINELIKMVDKPVDCIDSQLSKFEEDRKAEKREEITLFFKDKNTFPEFTLDRIWSDKWLNVSVTMKSIQSEIESALSRISDDMECISGFDKDIREQLVKHYWKYLTLTSVLQEKARLEEVKKQILENKKKQEEEEARKKEQPPIPEPAAQPATSPETPETVQTKTDEPLLSAKFKATGTRLMLLALKKFCDENSIKLEPIQ